MAMMIHIKRIIRSCVYSPVTGGCCRLGSRDWNDNDVEVMLTIKVDMARLLVCIQLYLKLFV